MSGFAEGTPTVTITLDKPRVLGFTLGTIRRAKELGVLNVNASDETALMLALPEYVWCCMDDQGRKDLSVAAIGELLHPFNVKEVAKQVGDLFKASVPKEDPDVKQEPAAETMPTAGNSTSINSGPLASTISG